jgi:uncharacterized membrane protein
MNLCNFNGYKVLFYQTDLMLGVQEILVVVFVIIALIYLVIKLFKRSKNHDCDKCS